jgi:hypothetical protein
LKFFFVKQKYISVIIILYKMKREETENYEGGK